MKAELVAISTGTVALALILGALFFQYALGYPPCEMCHWQRWPHIAAAIVGLGGGSLLLSGTRKLPVAVPVAAITIFLVAASGANTGPPA